MFNTVFKYTQMSETPSPTEMIDLSETAKRLGVEISTARRWVRQGKLQGYKLGGRTYRIKPADVDAFLEARLVTPIPV